MRTFLKLYFPILLSITLVGCASDKSEITSGGGAGTGIVSDGGTSSAAFAGTYSGELTYTTTGDSVNDTQVEQITLIVRTNGTAALAIDDESIDGVINGNMFGFSLRFVEVEDFVECEGTALVNGSITGNTARGIVSGSGECEFLTFDEDVELTGTLTATKL